MNQKLNEAEVDQKILEACSPIIFEAFQAFKEDPEYLTEIIDVAFAQIK